MNLSFLNSYIIFAWFVLLLQIRLWQLSYDVVVITSGAKKIPLPKIRLVFMFVFVLLLDLLTATNNQWSCCSIRDTDLSTSLCYVSDYLLLGPSDPLPR
jgi:hypothetical protein